MQATYMLYNTTKIMVSAVLAIVVTVLLILLMQSLIAMEPVEVKRVDYTPVDIFITENREIEVNKKEEIIKPIDPQPTPNIPPMESTYEKGGDLEIAIALPSPEIGIDVSLPDSGSALAIFRVAPEYPERAIKRGIEGFVDLMFDISPSGRTENIRIIHAEPSGYFEHASMRTLAKWKYQAAMKEGVPQAQKNQITRIVFELEK